MKRYIDLDKTVEFLTNKYNVKKIKNLDSFNLIINILEDIESMELEDVEEVVHCKDCVHYNLETADEGRYCEILRYESPIETGYCCYGCRKDGDNNNQTR